MKFIFSFLLSLIVDGWFKYQRKTLNYCAYLHHIGWKHFVRKILSFHSLTSNKTKGHPRSYYLGRLFGCEITHGNSTYNVDTTNEMVCIDDNRRMMYYERQLREPMQKKIWWWFILWIMNGRHFNKFYFTCTSIYLNFMKFISKLL